MLTLDSIKYTITINTYIDINKYIYVVADYKTICGVIVLLLSEGG